MRNVVLACDLGGTNLRIAAVGENGNILARTRRRTPNGDGAKAVLDAIASAAEECRSALGPSDELVAVAAAVPATVNFADGVMLKAPNLPCLDGFSMRGELEKCFGISSFLENDANAAAVGENWLGASKGCLNSVTVTLGTGVGGGIIINGSVLRGVDGTAGEIGHICVEPSGVACGCGSNGCVEQYASATGIVRMAEERRAMFPGSPLAGVESMTSLEVYEAGIAGDPLAREVFGAMGRYLGIALADLVNILNPEAIVIGGGAAGGWDLFMPFVNEEIGRRAFPEPAARAVISKAGLGDDAGILGAAKIAFDGLA